MKCERQLARHPPPPPIAICDENANYRSYLAHPARSAGLSRRRGAGAPRGRLGRAGSARCKHAGEGTPVLTPARGCVTLILHADKHRLDAERFTAFIFDGADVPGWSFWRTEEGEGEWRPTATETSSGPRRSRAAGCPWEDT